MWSAINYSLRVLLSRQHMYTYRVTNYSTVYSTDQPRHLKRSGYLRLQLGHRQLYLA